MKAEYVKKKIENMKYMCAEEVCKETRNEMRIDKFLVENKKDLELIKTGDSV